MRRLTRSSANEAVAGSRNATDEDNDSIPDSSGLRLGEIYDTGDLLSRVQQASETIKPGRVLREQYKQNGDIVVTCTSQYTASCFFRVFATEGESGLHALSELVLVHSQQCMKQASRARSAKKKKETKPCSPYDNTSGDEATPELEMDEVLAKYRSSSTDSGPSTSTPSSSSGLAASPLPESGHGLDTSPPTSRGRAHLLVNAKPKKARNNPTIQTRRSASVPKVAKGDDIVLPFNCRGSGQPAKLPSFKKQKTSIHSGQIDSQHFNPDVSSIEQLCAASAIGVSRHVEAFYAGAGTSRKDREDSGYSR